MAEAPAFDFVCEQVENRTELDRLESRGTVRLALKIAGLEARSVTPEQMRVVLEKVLPGELASRGIDSGESLCSELASGVQRVEGGSEGESPESVFARLGGRS